MKTKNMMLFFIFFSTITTVFFQNCSPQSFNIPNLTEVGSDGGLVESQSSSFKLNLIDDVDKNLNVASVTVNNDASEIEFKTNYSEQRIALTNDEKKQIAEVYRAAKSSLKNKSQCHLVALDSNGSDLNSSVEIISGETNGLQRGQLINTKDKKCAAPSNQAKMLIDKIKQVISKKLICDRIQTNSQSLAVKCPEGTAARTKKIGSCEIFVGCEQFYCVQGMPLCKQDEVFEVIKHPNSCPEYKCKKKIDEIACPASFPVCGSDEKLEVTHIPNSCPVYKCQKKNNEIACPAYYPICESDEKLEVTEVPNSCPIYKCLKK